jgi:hypothetical protein
MQVNSTLERIDLHFLIVPQGEEEQRVLFEFFLLPFSF